MGVHMRRDMGEDEEDGHLASSEEIRMKKS